MKRYAFIVGQEGPNIKGLETLQYVQNDIKSISEALEEIRSGYIVDAFSNNLNPIEVIAEFETLANKCKQDDTLLFYFSGHGYLNHGQLYLLFNQSDLERLVTTSIPISLVKSIFSYSKARAKVMILDCCHSAAATGSIFKSKGRLDVNITEPLIEASRESASAIITACGRFAVTREIPEYESGYLTYHLVQALTDKFKEADIDKDDLLSTNDFSEWIVNETDRFNEKREVEKRLEYPKVIQEVAGNLYLTACRVSVGDDLSNKLINQVDRAVDKIRREFESNPKYLGIPKLVSLARPIKRAAPTFTDLNILESLFKEEDSASIFAVATILNVRRDPSYLGKLITHIDANNLRPETIWRVLRAIRDTTSSYEFTSKGIEDITSKLRFAANRFSEVSFNKQYIPAMIVKICDRLKIPYKNVFMHDRVKKIEELSKNKLL